MEFRSHHVAISVRDLATTTEFYALFGFEPVFRMDDVDLSILNLVRPDGLLLEVFCYPENAARDARHVGVGNDMEQVGVKHFALSVDDIHATRAELLRLGHELTDVRHGRGGVDFFFVADPDGMWVEIVYDDRDLTHSSRGR